MSYKSPRQQKLTPVEKFDIALIERLRPLIDTRVGKAIGKVGNVGDQPPLLTLSAAMLALGLWRRNARLSRTGADMLLSHLAATAAKTVGKDNVDRSRPRQLIRKGRYKMKDGDSKDPAFRSFPSGHTAGAVALACAVARHYPAHRRSAYGAAALVGALQIPRKAHFLSDILAGVAIGAAAEGGVAWLLDRFEKVTSAPPENIASHRQPALPSAVGPR